MSAALVFEEKRHLADGAIIESRIWLLPKHLPPSTHRFKYSLFYGYPGRRVVCYDNERGKGDHRHLEDREEAYDFVSVDQLIADFNADVRQRRQTDV